MSEQPEDHVAHVDFGEVAAESVHESVEHEREITLADDLAPAATEPYLPVSESDDAEPASDPTAGETAVVEQGEPEESDYAPPSGAAVVNAITAAVRR